MGPGRTPTVHTCSLRRGGRGWLTHETTIHNTIFLCFFFFFSFSFSFPISFHVFHFFLCFSCTVRFQCESGDEDGIAKPDKRIDVIMRYRLISHFTKTIEEKTIR